MSATVPIDSLTRFQQATPEQREAIDRFLRGVPGEIGGGGQSGERGDIGGVLDALMRIEKKVDAMQARIAGAQAGPDIRVSEREAGRVFLLMQRLESRPKQRKASLGTVFRLLVLVGLSQRAMAARCGCVESLISARVVAIERTFGMSLDRLRNFASELLSLEAVAKGERTRKKKFGRPDDSDRLEVTESDGDDVEEGEGQRSSDEQDAR
ncbi:MAG: hypothetical protein NT154_28655 [Verrucomicrobia bacterium]|nr:hypothetical protein [Verrucomicrobiota bacterium]